MADKRDIKIKKRKPVGRMPSEEPKQAPGGGEEENGGLRALPARKKRRRGRSVLRIVFRLLLVAALVVGALLVYKNWDSIAPDSLVIWLEEKLSGGQGGDGFPVEITGSEVLDMAETRDGLALLTDTAYIVYNSNGGEVLRRPHGFSSPILKTAGKWALIAEAGGTRLRLENRSSTAAEVTAENKIVSAAVSADGNFAVCTESSQGYMSEIIVYNSKAEILYHRYVTGLIILDVALSPDGGSLAAIGVTAEAGGMKSSLLLYDLDKEDPVMQVDDTGLMFCAVGFFSNGAAVAVGDTGLWMANPDGAVRQKQEYGGKELAGFAIGEKNAVVVLQGSGGTEGGELMAVDSSGGEAYTLPYEGAYRHIAPSGSGALLLTGDHLYRTGESGLEDTLDAPRDGRLVSPLGNKVIVLGLTTLSEVS